MLIESASTSCESAALGVHVADRCEKEGPFIPVETGRSRNYGMRHASPASEALASVMPSVRLLVGVMTFNHTGRAARRAKIRQLCHTGDSSALFFVIPADSPDVDTDRPDMLRLHVPAVRRGVSGKYLLQNAYFRSAAASLPKTVRYVARMDDDAIVNAAAIEAQLRIVDAARERDELVLYGPFRNWCPLAPASPACPNPPACPPRPPASLGANPRRYLWHAESMQASCWAFNLDRWHLGLRRWREQERRANGTASARFGGLRPGEPYEPAGRGPHECLRPGQIGPFPFAAGPFIALSVALIRTIVAHPAFDRDEARHTRETAAHPGDAALGDCSSRRDLGVNS